MFMLGIDYLNGWAIAAADGARKEQAEWPPHPDRVFMALAAAWFETGENSEEGDALRWLETLPPPAIAASEHTTRSTVVSYVPVNDTTTSRKLLPEYRSKQPRSFPVAIPHDPRVYFVWRDAELGAYRGGLESLAAKVTYVGHSASFVRVWVVDSGEITTRRWEPTDGIARHRLRVFSTGRLDMLVQSYNQANILEYSSLKAQSDALKGRRSAKERKKKKYLDAIITERFGLHAPVWQRPEPTRWQGYESHREPELDYLDIPSSVFDPNLVVFAIRDRRLPVTMTLKLTQALRGALMDCCPEQPPPEWFSGHKPDKSPATNPHLALLPLPFAGDRYSDGRVMGLALALPRLLALQDARRCLESFLYMADTGLPRQHSLFDGQWFECQIELETQDQPLKNLNPDTWTRASRVWSSVTPVVLNRHFKGKDKWSQAAESIKEACEHIGLPRPLEVLLHPVSLVEGVPHAREYPQLTRKSDGGRQSHSHVVIVFEEPVRGPIIVGAGRYRGYGLCRPMDS